VLCADNRIEYPEGSGILVAALDVYVELHLGARMFDGDGDAATSELN
jgi:hypothetical protein